MMLGNIETLISSDVEYPEFGALMEGAEGRDGEEEEGEDGGEKWCSRRGGRNGSKNSECAVDEFAYFYLHH